MEHPTNLAIFSLKKNPRSNSSRVLFQPMPENGGKWYRRWPGQMMAWLFWPNYDISPTCFFLEIRGFPFLSYLLGERGRVRLRWNLTRLNEPTLKNKTSTWSKTKQQNKHKNLLLAWWGYFLWKSWEFRPQNIDPPPPSAWGKASSKFRSGRAAILLWQPLTSPSWKSHSDSPGPVEGKYAYPPWN